MPSIFKRKKSAIIFSVIEKKEKNCHKIEFSVLIETALQQCFSPGYCVWGEAEEGWAWDQVGDVDEVHEEDYLETYNVRQWDNDKIINWTCLLQRSRKREDESRKLWTMAFLLGDNSLEITLDSVKIFSSFSSWSSLAALSLVFCWILSASSK